MNPPEEKPYGLTTTPSGGLIRRMDQRLDLVNRLMEEIQAKQTGLSNTKTLEVPLGSGVVMLMKWCPAGSFLMGSPEDEEGRRSDENQVQVTLSQGFWMGQTQVTQAQWQAVMGNNPSYFKGENRPVERVSWDEAQEFVAKINASFVLSDGMQMTLPTEAQWEYSCRAGEPWPYSESPMDEVTRHGDNSGAETYPVGLRESNAWGLHDMHGNVFEWCADWYEEPILRLLDPQGESWAAPVLRCGCRGRDGRASFFGVAGRSFGVTAGSTGNVGFRVARSSVP
jgi:sulfatase modifying factor 1